VPPRRTGLDPTGLDPTAGTLVIKMADQVHNGRLLRQPYLLEKIARDLGDHVCDCVTRDRVQLPHNTTIIQRHFRRESTTWLVLHMANACPGGGIRRKLVCPDCGCAFTRKRRDQQTCSDTCRKRKQRDAASEAKSRPIRDRRAEAPAVPRRVETVRR
jgi:hypothetical protein